VKLSLFQMHVVDVGPHVCMLEHELPQLKCGLPPEDAIVYVDCVSLFLVITESFRSITSFIFVTCL